jgi:thioredoxin reductase (NADPH)
MSPADHTNATAPDPGPLDCAVIGAGPAGLTAAVYLARFHRCAVVFDGGRSRATWIPTSHNCPGFPEGVGGDELLSRLRKQASRYGAQIVPARVTEVHDRDGLFLIRAEGQPDRLARTVLLATGVCDVLPDWPWREEAVACGALRLCAICDGYEATDQDVAVFGPADSVVGHALFMRGYSRTVTVVPSDGEALADADRQRVLDAGLDLAATPASWTFEQQRCVSIDAGGARRDYDVVYANLGSAPGSRLALELGARVDEHDELIVDRQQCTSVPGLYAIGDVVHALNQIAVGQGHAVAASCAIHNHLPPRLR